jgi:hypothetical protein
MDNLPSILDNVTFCIPHDDTPTAFLTNEVGDVDQTPFALPRYNLLIFTQPSCKASESSILLKIDDLPSLLAVIKSMYAALVMKPHDVALLAFLEIRVYRCHIIAFIAYHESGSEC